MKPTSQPFLSIVIPAHNEEHRLPGSLTQIFEFLETQPYTAEVLVIENGSTDHTLEIARNFAAKYANLYILSTARRGKGLAVRNGMLAAHGKFRFLCDADLSMPIEEISRFLPPMTEKMDVVIGSREAPGAVRYHEPAYRHLIGRMFNTLVRWSALPGLQDTQCGFKCFRGAVAEDLFACQKLDSMSFDVEVLVIARMRGYRIAEIGIPWHFDPDSRVRLVQDSLRMGWDILTVRCNARRGKYDRRT